jgi:DNA-binding transcriptional MerR regulator
MTDSKIRLGTFRIPENTWKDFVAKARSNGDNASSILLNTVHAYLANEEISTSTAIAISSTPTNPFFPSFNNALASTPVIATSATTPLPLATPTNSPISILLAIAPDNQILYIDRGFPQDWNPPYHLRNAYTNADYRLEFLTASDSSILSPIEDALVKTFKPPFNFKAKANLDGHIDVDEPLQSTTPASIPLHISDRIHALLNNGLSPEDIHHALNSLHLHSKKSETYPNPNPNTEQINSAIASLTKITDRISALEENLIQLQLTNSQKHTTPEPNTHTTAQNQTEPKPLPLPLKGTASVKELPPPRGTTELAQRLNISVKRLEKVRSQYKDSTEGFFKYTLNKENGKFGWIYDPTQRLHIPYLEIPTPITSAPTTATATAKEMQTLPNPSDIKEKSESTPPKLNPDKSITKSKSTKKPKPKPLPNLNQSQLANRFGVNPSTLSRKRTSFSDGYISAQDFDSWCRTKDPDNFTWTFSEDSKDYTCQP